MLSSKTFGDRQTLLILGATGDLTARLLLPGVGSLLAHAPELDLFLLGCGRDDWDDDQWRDRVATSFASADADGPAVDRTRKDTRYVRADVASAEDLTRILSECVGTVSIFFALPPAVTITACETLRGVTLPEGTRLVLEKPFGTDEKTARDLNTLLTSLVPEQQIYRVDHFLGKSTILNLLGFRFANRLFEAAMSNKDVDRIDIVFDETLGLEGRAGYYDTSGALVDMIQSHLLQVLAVLTMEPPPSLDAEDVRDRTNEILRSVRVWEDDPVRYSRRARYTAGTIGDRALPAYVDEPGVDPARDTETLAEVVVEIDTWRWIGVPVTLRSGKALGDKCKEAVVTFKPAPKIPEGLSGRPAPERLIFGLDPSDLRLDVNINGPGDPRTIDSTELTAGLGPGELLPYGEVLQGVFSGDPMLSVRGDSAVECWRIVQPFLDAWKANEVPLDTYPAGSEGPASWTAPLVGAPGTEPLLD